MPVADNSQSQGPFTNDRVIRVFFSSTFRDMQKARELLVKQVFPELRRVGPDFIASPYCRDVEMRRAVERAETGDAVLIPIIVERCDWREEPFAAFQSLALDGSDLGGVPQTCRSAARGLSSAP